MKKTYFLFIIPVLLFISSCKKNDDSNSSTPLNNAITNGTWKITLFSEDGNDETNHFSGYNFTFRSNNTVSAQAAAVSDVNGTWTTGVDDSENKFVLDFGGDPLFSELNDDWKIISSTSERLVLQDVSGGNGGTDFLTFEKN